MRIFISADIEGVANTALWDHTRKNEYGYIDAAKEMSMEVRAACEGALEAGAEYIRIKDAHGSGTNIFPELLTGLTDRPGAIELSRSGAGTPWSMVHGINEGFDAAMFIGYHSAAGRNGNRMAHTYNTTLVYAKLNGVKMSEFMLYSLAAASAGVPTVFLAGDELLCRDSLALGWHPRLVTVPVKRGFGGLTTCLMPDDAQRQIREGVKNALSAPVTADALCPLPAHYELELCYKEHIQAVKVSYFPGFKAVDENTVLLSTDKLWDIMTAVAWVI